MPRARGRSRSGKEVSVGSGKWQEVWVGVWVGQVTSRGGPGRDQGSARSLPVYSAGEGKPPD